MTYCHDVALSAKLKSGKVLIAGGCEQPSGIGQTFNAELYDPETHSFRGFGILQRKRTWASALELDSGEVVITGNWYHNDGIEMFYEAQSVKGDHQYRQSFTYIRDVATQRMTPSIIRIAKDDALIFGPYGIRGDSLSCPKTQTPTASLKALIYVFQYNLNNFSIELNSDLHGLV